MERIDLELIERHVANDKVLEVLYREHLEFEQQLEKMNNKPFLTPNEEMERKALQKRKLAGRDRIEQILREYRKRDSLS